VRQAAVAKACKVEAAQLRAENVALRSEVELLRRNLVLAEAKNGVKQVRLPRRQVAVTPVAVETKVPVAAAADTAKPAAKADGGKKTAAADSAKPAAKADGGKKTAAADGGQADKAQMKEKEKPKSNAEAGDGAGEVVDVSRLDMRVGYIVNAKKHPDADALYVEEVDVGEGKTRTVVSGLVKHVTLDQLQNRHAVFLCNLKPAKLKGIASEAMIMCASTPEKVEIINVPEGATRGDRVTFNEYPGAPDAQLNPKKKTWEQIQPDLHINADGAASYKGAVWRVQDKLCTAPTMRNCPIK